MCKATPRANTVAAAAAATIPTRLSPVKSPSQGGHWVGARGDRSVSLPSLAAVEEINTRGAGSERVCAAPMGYTCQSGECMGAC